MDDYTTKAKRPPADERPSQEGRFEAPEDDRQNDRDAAAPDKPKRSWFATAREHPVWVALAAIVLIAALAAGIAWWINAQHYESTDDAFIDARIVTISAQISGAVSDALVTDNEVVPAGAVLFRIDDRIYRAQADQAKAQVDQARANVSNLDAQIDAQKARIDQAQKQVAQAQAALTFAQQEYDRYQDLAKTGSGTVQQAQQSRSNLLQSQAARAAAEANAEVAEKQLAVLGTQRKSAAAAVDIALAQERLAEVNLDYTVITAPVAGRITKLTGARGMYASPGQALSMFVPTDIWVTANFKETQLASVRPGQPVDLSIDAFPGRVFKGHVDSVQAGSGTAFSLFPAENATGNYVKVVQRVPTKIVFDAPPDVELGPGMSVVPTVTVR